MALRPMARRALQEAAAGVDNDLRPRRDRLRSRRAPLSPLTPLTQPPLTPHTAAALSPSPSTPAARVAGYEASVLSVDRASLLRGRSHRIAGKAVRNASEAV
jgi:hypothetical protein